MGNTYVTGGFTATVMRTVPSTTYTLTAAVPGQGAPLSCRTTLTGNGGQPCPAGCRSASYFSSGKRPYVNPYGPNYELG